MSRNAVLALCAIAAVAIVWLLVRSGEPGEGSGSARATGAAAESPAGGAAGSASSGRETGSAGFASGAGGAPARAGGLAVPRGASGAAEGAGAGAGTFDPDASGERGAGPDESGSDAEATAMAEEAARRAQQQPADETVASPDGGAATEEASPSDSDQQGIRGEILSGDEITRRVETQLPDGSMPDDQLALARQKLAAEILQKSQIANSLVRSEGPEQAEAATAKPPAPPPETIRPPVLPPTGQRSSGSSNSVSR